MAITKEQLNNMILKEDKLITISHARQFTPNGGCKPGFESFLESNGISFKEVVKNRGVKASQLIATGDIRAIGLAIYVYELEGSGYE